MDDRFGRSKWGFWLFVLALTVVIAVPSAVLVRTVESYYQFLTGAAPGTIRPVQVDFLDRRNDSKLEAEKDLQFMEFHLSAPKAKNVELVGDFNGWKAGTLPLSRSGAAWEVMLPLPPGRYHYRFLVDGQAQADPHAPSEAGADGKPASLRMVP